MSNILLFLDMLSKHVRFYPETGLHVKDLSMQKVKTWNRSLDFIMLIINHINNVYFLFQSSPWKSAAKRSLCDNLLIHECGAPGTTFHHPVSDKIRLHSEIHPYGNNQAQTVLCFQAG